MRKVELTIIDAFATSAEKLKKEEQWVKIGKATGNLNIDEYRALSEWQKFMILVRLWKVRTEFGWGFWGMWTPDILEEDWMRPKDWWHRKYWRFGIYRSQSYEHIDFGPCRFFCWFY